MNLPMLVMARSGATKQSSWNLCWIAAAGFAGLAMTNKGVHQQRSEESSRTLALADTLRESNWILRFAQNDRPFFDAT